MYILQKHNLNMLISNKLYVYDFTSNLHFLQKQFYAIMVLSSSRSDHAKGKYRRIKINLYEEFRLTHQQICLYVDMFIY